MEIILYLEKSYTLLGNLLVAILYDYFMAALITGCPVIGNSIDTLMTFVSDSAVC